MLILIKKSLVKQFLKRIEKSSFLRINLIRNKLTNQVDPYACCGVKLLTDSLFLIVDHLNPNLYQLQMT